VTLLLNSKATRGAILSTLVDKFYLQDKADENSRILFFFGGHGTTLYYGSNASNQEGYIVPYDADNRTSSLISMDDLYQVANTLRQVRHVLFLY